VRKPWPYRRFPHSRFAGAAEWTETGAAGGTFTHPTQPQLKFESPRR